MNYLDYSSVDESKGYPFTLGDMKHLIGSQHTGSHGLYDAIYGLSRSLGSNYIVSGCEVTTVSSLWNVSSGWVVINNQLLYCPDINGLDKGHRYSFIVDTITSTNGGKKYKDNSSTPNIYTACSATLFPDIPPSTTQLVLINDDDTIKNNTIKIDGTNNSININGGNLNITGTTTNIKSTNLNITSTNLNITGATYIKGTTSIINSSFYINKSPSAAVGSFTADMNYIELYSANYMKLSSGVAGGVELSSGKYIESNSPYVTHFCNRTSGNLFHVYHGTRPSTSDLRFMVTTTGAQLTGTLTVSDITSSGNLTLTSGGVSGTINMSSGSGGVIINGQTGNVNISSTSGQVRIGETGGNVYLGNNSLDTTVFIYRSGGYKQLGVGSGDVLHIAASDIKLKKDINKSNYGIDTIINLNTISYNWNDDYKEMMIKKSGIHLPENSTKQEIENYNKTIQNMKDSYNITEIGFIAQEVQEIIPEIVKYNEQYEYLGIDYSKLTVILTKAIQEQQVMIEDLQKRLSDLVK